MATDYMDQWNINGVQVEIHDAGRAQSNGVATLDENGRIPYSQLPESAVELKGYWNANTNTPTLVDGTGTNGDEYYVAVEGSQNLGSGAQYFNVGDRVLYLNGTWKNINGTSVKSVNSRLPSPQGNVDISSSAIRADSTTITGVTVQNGDIVRLLFTQALTSVNANTALSLTYNDISFAVKVAKDGALVDFMPTEITSGTYTYLQAYTTMSFIVDTENAYFIVQGNPIVLSSTSHTIYANGKTELYNSNKTEGSLTFNTTTLTSKLTFTPTREGALFLYLQSGEANIADFQVTIDGTIVSYASSCVIPYIAGKVINVSGASKTNDVAFVIKYVRFTKSMAI